MDVNVERDGKSFTFTLPDSVRNLGQRGLGSVSVPVEDPEADLGSLGELRLRSVAGALTGTFTYLAAVRFVHGGSVLAEYG